MTLVAQKTVTVAVRSSLLAANTVLFICLLKYLPQYSDNKNNDETKLIILLVVVAMFAS